MLTAEQMLEKGHRTLDWATGVLDGENGFAGADGLINGHYKATMAFMAGGRVREARLVARYLHRRFFRDGDYHAVAGDPTASGLMNYRNAWVARGVHVLGRYDLSTATAALLEREQDKASGGIPAGSAKQGAERELDWGTTGSAALALMAMGRWEAAARCGDFLVGMMRDQPDTRATLYLRRRLTGEIIRDNIVQGLATSYAIDVGKPGQIYWYLGIAMNAFAGLLLATGDAKWRDAGYAVLEYMKNCHQEIYEIISNGKVAWGLGGFYLATRDATIAKMAQDVWAWHYRIQEPDGRWLRVGQFPSIDQQPLHVTLDTSLERAFYMFELSRTLDV